MISSPTTESELRTAGVDFQFYFGAASGSARRALQQAETKAVCLNYATEHNQPWPGIEDLLIDPGGYSFMHGMGEYETPPRAYLDFVETHEPTAWGLRDIPADPATREALGGWSVAEIQDRTTELHGELLDKWRARHTCSSCPMAILQGWHPEQYVEHLDQLADRDCLSDYVGIGSLVNQDTEQAAAVIERVDEVTARRTDLHAFGLKTEVLQRPRVVEALASGDSMAFEKTTRMEEHDRQTDGRSWRDLLFHYLRYRRGIEDILHNVAATGATAQTTLASWEAGDADATAGRPPRSGR